MARLNSCTGSGDELPDIADLLREAKISFGSSLQKQDDRPTSPASPGKTTAQNRRQRPLKIAHANSLLLPLTSPAPRHSEEVNSHAATEEKAIKGSFRALCQDKHRDNKYNGNSEGVKLRSSPRKAVRQRVEYSTYNLVQEKDLGEHSYSSSGDHLSDFVVDDTDSDLEAPPLRSPSKNKKGIQKGDSSSRTAFLPDKPSPVIDLTSPKKPSSVDSRPQTPPSDPIDAQSDEENLGHLRFSPPHSRTPHKHAPDDRPRTPPSSLPKAILRSPTKSFHRIPPSPHRPSIDAFWSQEVINDWNDQYSPQKLTSPRKLFSVREDDEANLSPSTSPRKSPLKSPSKRDKAAIARRKAFDDQKHQLATSFLQELDTKVTDGGVTAMAESAGGIKIMWSRKLNSTAGRANWKRETLRSKPVDGSTSSATTTTHRHHASIELAEKVIDDADRLRNVLAHEYCHLANFMISNVKNNPHGKEFKAWAAKTTALFADQGIRVTTTHSYAIQYKYIWACTTIDGGCGMEFKRHSKSIDPRRHSCGVCRSKLVQVQPAPRKGKGSGDAGEEGGGKAELSDYQRFVKSNFARVKAENPGVGVGEVMRRLGEEFRRLKAEGRVREGEKGKREEIVVSDDDEEEGEEEKGGMNDVVRKLDFLNLG